MASDSSAADRLAGTDRPIAGAAVAVAAAFALQVLGGGFWFAAFEHGDPALLSGLFRALPTPVGVALGVFALPAIALAVAVGAGIELLTGASLRAPGIGLLGDEDLPFLVAAALCSLLVGVLIGRLRGDA